MMKRQLVVVLCFLILGFGWAGVSTGQGHPPPPQAAPAAAVTEDSPWRLVWADEFDTDGLPDPKKWGYDVGRSVANNVNMFPAVDLFLADSEFRDKSQVSFRPETRAAFKAFAGHSSLAAVH